MKLLSRRVILPAVILAAAATLGVWFVASAAVPRSKPDALTTMHFKTVMTSSHESANGSTQAKPAGGTFQETEKLVAGGKKIGRTFLSCTAVSDTGWFLCNLEARFPHRGRVELQGAFPGTAKTNTLVITGGTGVFTTARGWAVSQGNNVTVTFR